MNDFLEVFLDDFPWIPSECEIYFDIDLLPDTQPISIPPNLMASTELRELKAQHKNFLDKGFVLPRYVNGVHRTICEK